MTDGGDEVVLGFVPPFHTPIFVRGICRLTGELFFGTFMRFLTFAVLFAIPFIRQISGLLNPAEYLTAGLMDHSEEKADAAVFDDFRVGGFVRQDFRRGDVAFRQMENDIGHGPHRL